MPKSFVLSPPTRKRAHEKAPAGSRGRKGGEEVAWVYIAVIWIGAVTSVCMASKHTPEIMPWYPWYALVMSVIGTLTILAQTGLFE